MAMYAVQIEIQLIANKSIVHINYVEGEDILLEFCLLG